jgi:hypothetical protein
LTETKPSIAGQYVKPFAWAVSATKIVVAPQAGWEVSPSIYTVSGPLAATIVQGRLEYSSATQLVYTLAKGRALGLWNGNDVKLYTPNSDVVLTNTSDDIDGNALATDSVYAVFAEVDALGAVTLSAKKWSSITSRGFTLYEWNDMLIHENSNAGRKRRYLGDIYMYNNSGTAEFKDGEYLRYIVNYYNRVSKRIRGSFSSSGSYDCSATSYQEVNGGTDWRRIKLIVPYGGCDILVVGQVSVWHQYSNNSKYYLNIGVNSTSTESGCRGYSDTDATGMNTEVSTQADVSLSEGFNYITLIEHADSTASVTLPSKDLNIMLMGTAFL